MRIERTYIALEAERQAILEAQDMACDGSLDGIVQQQAEILMLLAPYLDGTVPCVLSRGRILTPDPTLSSPEDEKREKRLKKV